MTSTENLNSNIVSGAESDLAMSEEFQRSDSNNGAMFAHNPQAAEDTNVAAQLAGNASTQRKLGPRKTDRLGVKVAVPSTRPPHTNEEKSPDIIKAVRENSRESGLGESERSATPLRPRPSSTGRFRGMGDAGPTGVERLYNAALEKKKLVLEKSKEQVDAEYPFQPTLYTSSSNSTRTQVSGDARFNLLYEDATQKSKRLEAKQQEVPEDCTFKPTISRKASKSDVGGVPGSVFDKLHARADQQALRRLEQASAVEHVSPPKKVATRESQQEFQQRLVESDAKLQEKLKRLQEEEVQRELADCSFHPKIATSKRAQSANRAARAAGGEPVHARLLQYASQQEAHRKELEQAVQAKIAEETPFRPQILNPSRHHSQENVFERLAKPDAERRQAKLANVDAEASAELTFKPNVPKGPVKVPRSTKPAHERLHEDHLARQEKLARIAAEREAQERENCTFVPEIGGPTLQPEREPVWTRLNGKAHEDALHRQKAKNDIALDECTFQPAVDTSIIGSSHSGADSPDNHEGGDVFERLAKPILGETALAKLKEEQELAGCTFQPQVEHRRTQSQSGDIFERLNQEAQLRERRLQARREEQEQKERETSTFSPELPARRPSPARPARAGSASRRSDSPLRTRGSRTSSLSKVAGETERKVIRRTSSQSSVEKALSDQAATSDNGEQLADTSHDSPTHGANLGGSVEELNQSREQSS